MDKLGDIVGQTGRLPIGETLAEAIGKVDAASDGTVAYFMVNCAHPDHFSGELTDAPWAHRIRGLRCNASRKSHAEPNNSETLDDGNPDELASQYAEIKARMPWPTSSAAAAAPTFAT
jgi:S-methylmethionine-dependent homocysteine/selenocysteine methylase